MVDRVFNKYLRKFKKDTDQDPGTSTSGQSYSGEGSSSQSSTFQPYPKTPRIQVNTHRQAHSKGLQDFCYEQPVAVIEGLLDTLGIDPDVFSSHTLVEGVMRKQKVSTVLSQYTVNEDEATINSKKKKNWSFLNLRKTHEVNLMQFASDQAECWDQYQKEVERDAKSRGRSRSTKTGWKECLCGIIEQLNPSAWGAQLEQLRKLPSFLRTETASEAAEEEEEREAGGGGEEGEAGGGGEEREAGGGGEEGEAGGGGGGEEGEAGEGGGGEEEEEEAGGGERGGETGAGEGAEDTRGEGEAGETAGEGAEDTGGEGGAGETAGGAGEGGGEEFNTENMLLFPRFKLKGMQEPQLDMMTAGAKVSIRQEDSHTCSVYINMGPEDCEWFAVSYDYSKGFIELSSSKKAGSFRNAPLWMDVDELKAKEIPVHCFLQHKGDMVWIGPGTFYCLQALGVVNTVNWNMGAMTHLQYWMAVSEQMWWKKAGMNAQVSAFDRAPVPMLDLTWRIARRCTKNSLRDTRLAHAVQYVCNKSLAKLITWEIFAMEENLATRQYDFENPCYCNECKARTGVRRRELGRIIEDRIEKQQHQLVRR